jgi:hypothetical protein
VIAPAALNQRCTLDAGHAYQPCRQGGTTDTATPSSSRSSSWWPRPTRGGSYMWCSTTTAPHPSHSQGPARQASARPPALHPDFGELDEPGRGVRLHHHPPGDPAGQLRQRRGPGRCHPPLRRWLDQRRQPFVWVKDADDIMSNATRKRTSGTRHSRLPRKLPATDLTDPACLLWSSKRTESGIAERAHAAAPPSDPETRC